MCKRNILDHYFNSVYNKLEADAILFNRKLPHSGLKGSENEIAIASLIREFLPSRFGVEVSGIVIDKHGNESKQCDIIIYDADSFPKYFRKVFPVELTFAVIEVKTYLTSQKASDAIDNLKSLFELDFRPNLTNYWKTESVKKKLQAMPPSGFVFAYRSDTEVFETFSSWFPHKIIDSGIELQTTHKEWKVPEFRTIGISVLDQGFIEIEKSNTHITRMIPIAEKDVITRSFETKYEKEIINVDPVKVLFFFLENLWWRVSSSRTHPGFDIRSYMTDLMGSYKDAGGN